MGSTYRLHGLLDADVGTEVLLGDGIDAFGVEALGYGDSQGFGSFVVPERWAGAIARRAMPTSQNRDRRHAAAISCASSDKLAAGTRCSATGNIQARQTLCAHTSVLADSARFACQNNYKRFSTYYPPNSATSIRGLSSITCRYRSNAVVTVHSSTEVVSL